MSYEQRRSLFLVDFSSNDHEIKSNGESITLNTEEMAELMQSEVQCRLAMRHLVGSGTIDLVMCGRIDGEWMCYEPGYAFRNHWKIGSRHIVADSIHHAFKHGNPTTTFRIVELSEEGYVEDIWVYSDGDYRIETIPSSLAASVMREMAQLLSLPDNKKDTWARCSLVLFHVPSDVCGHTQAIENYVDAMLSDEDQSIDLFDALLDSVESE